MRTPVGDITVAGVDTVPVDGVGGITAGAVRSAMAATEALPDPMEAGALVEMATREE